MTRRPDLVDPMRFGHWLLLGFGGILNMLGEFTVEGGLISDNDYDKLVMYYDRIGKLIEHHTMHTPKTTHERAPRPGNHR